MLNEIGGLSSFRIHLAVLLIQIVIPQIETMLKQPLLSSEPEYGHAREDVLSLEKFLSLLREEENYFEGGQENIKLSITRLRKIFYDKWGWNTQLIRKAALIKGRYEVKIVPCLTTGGNSIQLKQVRKYKNNTYRPKCRQVTYRADDRVYGSSKVNQVPEIYCRDHADVLLPEGYHCDMGHVLAGLDALNNRQPVSPLPDWLFFLHRYFPYADSNADVATWLGDIATSAMDFVFAFLANNRRPLAESKEQHLINVNASASDMLGDIDAYVIYYFYNTGSFRGRRLTEILQEYYGEAPGQRFRQQRFPIFAKFIGLGAFNGSAFTNEKKWIEEYTSQLRNSVCFMIFSVSSDWPQKIQLPYKVWQKEYERVIKVEELLSLFLNALKKAMAHN
jgi:hypothetical protein